MMCLKSDLQNTAPSSESLKIQHIVRKLHQDHHYREKNPFPNHPISTTSSFIINKPGATKHATVSTGQKQTDSNLSNRPIT